ncbi:MAG: excinuclease ABC subunit UvrC [Thermodesulfobacteria bacterium]|nr:excinuclease ABC subunit UvrC [Thermodesulfobacteriota bacterium]
MLEINLKEVPESPGVYLFKDARGHVLYVGKAKNLRNRLSSYVKGPLVSPKLWYLVNSTQKVDYILTTNEKEALLLEATLIKKYRPKYNVVFKDDKNYPLLRLSLKEKYPRLQIVRRRRKGDNAIYFGPFTSAKGLREILKLISKLYPLRRCSNAEMQRRKRPCIYYQIKKCLAPCVNDVPEEEYKKLVNGVIEFFQGGGKRLIEELKAEMEKLAENLEFERAAFLRDRIKELEKILQDQAVVLDKQVELDFWKFKKIKDHLYAVVLFVRYGYLYGFQSFKVRATIEESPEKSLLLQFYTDGKIIPEKVIARLEEEDKRLIEEVLKELAGKEVRVGDEEEFLVLEEIARKNLENFILFEEKKEGIDYEVIKNEVMRVLRLEHEPRWIEAIDLSQFYGDARVGAIVCFFEGMPEKDRYRKYHIKTEAKDDYGMLYEVLYRRMKRGMEEDNLPDLMLIDGGKAHLETALRVAEDLGLKGVEFRAVAKNEKRQPEKLYIPYRKNPIFLTRHREVFQFVGKIMEEAHRFAKTFALKTKIKTDLASILEEVKGIGPKRREVILKNFKSIEEILETPIEKIAKLPGFNLKVASSLKQALATLETKPQDQHI